MRIVNNIGMEVHVFAVTGFNLELLLAQVARNEGNVLLVHTSHVTCIFPLMWKCL